jgi:carboxypeptidase Taq
MHYDKLHNHHERVSHLAYAKGQLYWDESAMMPAGGGEIRAKAMATLEGLIHQNLTADWIADSIQRAEEETLDGWKKKNLSLLKQDYVSRNALSQEFVERKTYALSRSEQAWPTFKENNDWKGFLPIMEEIFSIQKEEAEILGDTLKKSPYDALLHQYEPELKAEFVDPLFAKLKTTLPMLIQDVRDQQSDWKLIPFPDASEERQYNLSVSLMKKLGFDFNHGRLDTSAHPFCGGDPRDVRLTTRYDTKDLSTSLMSVLHETGHAMYEQGLPREWLDQPVGKGIGMAAHESQSLFVEMQICLGQPFLNLLSKHLKKELGDHPSFSASNLATRYHRVQPGFIRVDSDELTYPMHVILRYEIEKDLFAGKMQVRDIPERWNAMMVDFLGIDPKDNHGQGCLQDVHWPSGLFGYFPDYTLGAMIAACIRKKMNQDLPNLDQSIEQEDFTEMFQWLRKNFHGHGSRMNTRELLVDITGHDLDVDVYLSHLKQRYLSA